MAFNSNILNNQPMQVTPMQEGGVLTLFQSNVFFDGAFILNTIMLKMVDTFYREHSTYMHYSSSDILHGL